MASQQLLDILPSYISFYQQQQTMTSPTVPTANPDRTSILKWFSSLSTSQRLSYLTIVDPKFSQLLLLMLCKLRSHGRGTFFILPDVPSYNQPHIPTLLFRKSRGLLSRISEWDESERLIRDSTRLFSSKEGQSPNSYGFSPNCLDTVTFCEGFISDIDQFVEAMDKISGLEFLQSGWGEFGSDWIELGWLKAKGYYSLEAFVANRVEVALRLAWLSCNGGKKRGVKLKEKANGAVGMSANVYWRKKGCVDWWSRLEEGTRKKALLMITGKTTKLLIGEILKGAGRDLGEQMWLFSSEAELPMRCNVDASTAKMASRQDEKFLLKGVSSSGNSFSFDPEINGLFVLQDIIHLILAFQHDDFDKSELFFSTLDSVNTIRDCMLRKFRGLFMVVSLDSTRHELLEDDKSEFSAKKSKDKQRSSIHKKKEKIRGGNKFDSSSKNRKQCRTSQITPKDNEPSLVDKRDSYMAESSNLVIGCLLKEVKTHELQSLEETQNQKIVDQKVQTAKRKVRKGSSKKRNSCQRLGDEAEVQNAKVEGTSSFYPLDHSEEKNWAHAPDSLPVPKNILQCSDFSIDGSQSNIHPSHSCVVGSQEVALPGDIAAKFSGSEDSLGAQVVSKLDKGNCSQDGTPDSSKMTNEESALDLQECPQNSASIQNRNLSSSESKSSSKVNIDISHEKKNWPLHHTDPPTSSGSLSYEWPPSVAPHFPCLNSYYLPHATDRLHLEVGQHFNLSVPRMHQTCNSSLEVGCGRILSRPLSLSVDLPPLVGSLNGLTPPLTCNYDSGYHSNRQCTMQQGFGAQNAYFNTFTSEDEKKNSSEFVDLSDRTSTQDAADEFEGQWVSEEEYEMHTMNCLDYNQYFGGGIMYWNPSDFPGTGFSRPPSLSSDDSSWAWREADMNRTVDDMVGFSTSYNTNGLASPSTAPFCSPFESLGLAQQAVSFARPVNEVTSKAMHQSSEFADAENQEEISVDIDGKSSDSLPYPILRPIIVPNISRDRSRSEFKRNLDLRSPCVPPNRREKPHIKRPPSPVVLCVPHAPRPPPPSPVGDSRKQRGLPMVRSGSSSPRNWGVRGLLHDGTSFDEACVHMDGAELFWPSWGSKKMPTRQMVQPLTGALLQERLIAISQLTHDQEHPDVALPLQPPEQLNCPKHKESLLVMQNLLQGEIDSFCKKVATENLMRRPYINWAVKRVTRSLQVLWPRSRTNIFGSNATGLSLPTSDVDLVVCLPPVRNLEPIKEAGILEGRNGIKETCLQHAARYLANQEWVKPDSLKTLENTMIPLIMLVVEVPCDFDPPAASVQIPRSEPAEQKGDLRNYQREITCPDHFLPCRSRFSHNRKGNNSVRLDISFKSPSHTGLQTTKLVQQLTEQFPAAVPLALVLKKFLADRSLDQAYSGGLSSYCLVLLIIRFLQHEHHLGRAINQNLGRLLIDFLYFFGNVFDPRQMRVSVQGSGLYVNRERGYSIDPIYIDDPLFPMNNVGKNCFRIHQCIKAFADAYATLESELSSISKEDDKVTRPPYQVLQKLIPSISLI